MQSSRYKTINLGTGNSPGSPNGWAQLDWDRAKTKPWLKLKLVFYPRVFMINTPAQGKSLHTWIKLPIVKQYLVKLKLGTWVGGGRLISSKISIHLLLFEQRNLPHNSVLSAVKPRRVLSFVAQQQFPTLHTFAVGPTRSHTWGASTLASLSLGLKDLLKPITRVKTRKKNSNYFKQMLRSW